MDQNLNLDPSSYNSYWNFGPLKKLKVWQKKFNHYIQIIKKIMGELIFGCHMDYALNPPNQYRNHNQTHII
jgi:hypothetical protein